MSFCIYILKSISTVQFGKHFLDDNIHFLLVIDEFDAML